MSGNEQKRGKFFDDLINKYIEAHKEEMRLLDQRTSRSGIIKRALYEFFRKEGMIPSRTIQEDTFRLHIMEVFRTLYSVSDKTEMNRESPQETERKVRKYIYEQAEKWGKELTPQYVDGLVEKVMELRTSPHDH